MDFKFLRLLIQSKQNSIRGLSLIEVLVATFISGIVLTVATSGMINLVTNNQEIESKSTRSISLDRALSYIEDDIKGSVSLTKVKNGTGFCSSSSVDSECLVLNYPDNFTINTKCKVHSNSTRQIYYGLEDISNKSSSIWLKPGVLKRKTICGDKAGNWMTVVDGLKSSKEEAINPICNQNDITWTGSSIVHGDIGSNKGGFRFCLENNPATEESRLVRIFLYGHIVTKSENDTIAVDLITYARAH